MAEIGKAEIKIALGSRFQTGYFQNMIPIHIIRLCISIGSFTCIVKIKLSRFFLIV
jgi:hypothetical protein